MPAEFVPTDEQRQLVMRMSAAGIRQELIARCVVKGGIDDKTLRRHFREELDTTMPIRNAEVAGWLFENCRAGNVAAQIFWMKSRGGWKETASIEMSGPDGQPIPTSIEVVFVEPGGVDEDMQPNTDEVIDREWDRANQA